MGEESLSEVGDLLFSLVIGYIGALEFLYVVRHLYHWTFRHATINEAAANNEENLKRLQDSMRSQLAEAKAKESEAGGINAMRDGVLYKDGFRIESQESKEQRRKEIETELARQRKIEEETRVQLARAEAELEKQRLEAAALADQQEAEEKLLAAERAREEAQAEEERQRAAEAAESAKRIFEAEQQKEAEERRLEMERLEAAALADQREAEEKLLAAERAREEAQAEEERQRAAEAAESAKRIFEAEQQKEAEERRLEMERLEAAALADQREAEEKLLAAERAREEAQAEKERQRAEAAESAKRIFEAEQQKAEERRLKEQRELSEREEQARIEEEENATRILEAERLREADERLKEQAAEEQRLAAEGEQREYEENVKRLLEADQRQREEQRIAEEEEAERELSQQQLSEQARLLLEAESEQERKEKLKEENARKFLEAEEEMVAELQRQMEATEAMQTQQLNYEQDMLAEVERQMEAAETIQQRQLPFLNQQVSVVEEPCIKKNISTLKTSGSAERLSQTVKTQFGQNDNELYSLSSKSLHFPGVADDASSVEPTSSQQSSFSTQPSDEITTGTEETAKEVSVLGIDIQLEREAPDGEDNAPTMQYTDEYLRSLDGIKQRPLVREDGSGRRRAFKKRRSSGSSNSSRDSRTSREEEIKMFTSLEEEEMDIEKKGDDDFAAIKYSSEPTLKVKSHHRRHKRSPAKDAKIGDEKSSLEMLDEENSNPWGEVVPEHYKDTAFWKREKAISIDEEDNEPELPLTQHEEEEEVEEKQAAKSSSFEEANDNQNKEALSALQQHHSRVVGDNNNEATGEFHGDENKNLQTSQNTEGTSSPARSTSPRLRRSPRIDEIDQYEERWKETVDNATPITVVTPTITLDNAPWTDDHGLLMEGLSDFYDFTASINPSRSRPTSRASTPTSPKPSITFPKNVSYSPGREENNETIGMIELYDDAGNFEIINKSAAIEFIRTLTEDQTSAESFQNAESFLAQNLRNIADEPEKRLSAEVMPTILIVSADDDSAPFEDTRYLSRSRSRSRSRSCSPLPTPSNIERSLETRRSKLIQHNDEIFEKLKENVPDLKVQLEPTASVDDIKIDNNCFKEDMNLLVESLRAERCKSTSRSRSPLPTTTNIQRSLEARRDKLIHRNDEIMKTLEPSQEVKKEVVETPSICVELIHDNDVVIDESNELSEENMATLVETLRIARSKSRSKTPMHVEFKYVYEFVESAEDATYNVSVPRPRSRSVTPLRSPIIAPVENTTAKEISNETVEYQSTDCSVTSQNFEDYVIISTETLSNLRDYCDFHQMLNLEASNNKTLTKNTEEIESNLALTHRSVDEEALDKLRTANEEVELRTISPSYTEKQTAEHEETENLDKFEHTIDKERLRQLKCTPTTPEYDRTISKEWQDVQRIKEEIIASGYKRSTYVGESLDIGSEFEELRRQTAQFQRSQSRSRSPTFNETELIENARRKAADARQIQNDILSEITTVKQEESRGAKPKTDSKKSSYERSLSKELIDTQRIKEAMLSSGFQRSTYAGESLDMSAQFEDLRRSTAEFRRSQSKSRSPPDTQKSVEMARIDDEAAKRYLQDRILDEMERTGINFQEFSRHLNADFLDSERRASDSLLMQKPEIIFQFEDTDFSLDLEPEEYHHYRRFSLYQEPPTEEYPSDSGDYMYVSETGVFTEKGTGSWLREDYYSENLEKINIEESDIENAANLSTEILKIKEEGSEVLAENESAAIVDEAAAVVAVKEDGNIEEVVETLQENEVVATPQYEKEAEDETAPAMEEDEIAAALQANEDAALFFEDEDTDGSEDERRTVVDVEDEIEEDIGDFNDRGPTDESHHEQSECEEADREVDRYADRSADDWQHIVVMDNLLAEQEQIVEGATGGSESVVYDSDSFAIDQIYDEAVRNRKQSGIMRDYDCILQDMQKSFVEKASNQNRDKQLETQVSTESDHYALWAKTRDLERSNSRVESSLSLIESERNDSERRYLGDATVSARNATRLRSRYGYVPILQSSPDAEIEVDLDYKPKREYNWRKNFKLDEENVEKNGNNENGDVEFQGENYEIVNGQILDSRKYSLGGESITLFSRSPDREILPEVVEEETVNIYAEPEVQSTLDPAESAVPTQEKYVEKKQKTKKKSKKKTRKDSKGAIDTYAKDDDDSENQIPYEYNRRSSSLQMETDSPKRKSRSRRSSKSSLVNEDSIELYSPRSSIGYAEPYGEFEGDNNENAPASLKKKTKKRKKAKEIFMHEPEIKEEHINADAQPEILPEPIPVSVAISPEAASMNILSTLSPQNSVCVTPASIESDTYIDKESNESPATTTSTATPVSTTSTITATAARVTESFDLLKDGNFYPLF